MSWAIQVALILNVFAVYEIFVHLPWIFVLSVFGLVMLCVYGYKDKTRWNIHRLYCDLDSAILQEKDVDTLMYKSFYGVLERHGDQKLLEHLRMLHASQAESDGMIHCYDYYLEHKEEAFSHDWRLERNMLLQKIQENPNKWNCAFAHLLKRYPDAKISFHMFEQEKVDYLISVLKSMSYDYEVYDVYFQGMKRMYRNVRFPYLSNMTFQDLERHIALRHNMIFIIHEMQHPLGSVDRKYVSMPLIIGAFHQSVILSVDNESSWYNYQEIPFLRANPYFAATSESYYIDHVRFSSVILQSIGFWCVVTNISILLCLAFTILYQLSLGMYLMNMVITVITNIVIFLCNCLFIVFVMLASLFALLASCGILM